MFTPETNIQPEIKSPPFHKDPFAKSPISEEIWSDEIASQSFHRGPHQRRKGFVLIAFSWLAATIDVLFLAGMSLLFLVAFVMVMKNSHMPQSLWLLAGSLIFALLSFFYMIFLRSFLGFTIGEWACSLRLGSPLERQSKFYSLKVIVRMLLVVSTGIITLPLLGLLFRKDLAGSLAGVRLISLK